MWLGLPVEAVAGRGTGVDDAGLHRKQTVIHRAIEVNRASLGDPLATLSALGGYEIAAIAGLALGGAANRVPVVIDGFISSAGALAAVRLNPAAADYLFFGDPAIPRKYGATWAIRNGIGATPILDLDLRLGEGTGAALAMTLLDAAVKVYNEMATFSSAGVSGRTA